MASWKRGSREWDIARAAPPWGERPSILSHILEHIQPGSVGLRDGGAELPDEANVRGDSGLGWAPGARDGVFGHHVTGAESEARADAAMRALRSLLEDATDANAAAFYSVVSGGPALALVDPLLERVVASELDAERLHGIARWLTVSAADREAVKLGMALFTTVWHEMDRRTVGTLGHHDEFTPFAVVALRSMEERPDRTLWALGQQVRGWGRIHVVEALASTEDEQIQAWLLREGYANEVMVEYTALICARTGRLRDALELPEPDDALLDGAGEILAALIRGCGGPAAGMESYADGAAATELYLRHLRSRSLATRHRVVVEEVREFLDEPHGVADDSDLGWPARQGAILELAEEYATRPGWRERVLAELASDDEHFWAAAAAAPRLGIDLWPFHFDRVKGGRPEWHYLMQSEDPERIDRVLELAERVLPLDALASGPALESALGRGSDPAWALGLILQGLDRFPGKGWPLIRVGLRSPMIRNRNMAARALAAWPRAAWPPGADALLRRSHAEEPDHDARERMRQALDAGG